MSLFFKTMQHVHEVLHLLTYVSSKNYFYILIYAQRLMKVSLEICVCLNAILYDFVGKFKN